MCTELITGYALQPLLSQRRRLDSSTRCDLSSQHAQHCCRWNAACRQRNAPMGAGRELHSMAILQPRACPLCSLAFDGTHTHQGRWAHTHPSTHFAIEPRPSDAALNCCLFCTANCLTLLDEPAQPEARHKQQSRARLSSGTNSRILDHVFGGGESHRFGGKDGCGGRG